MTFKSCIIEIGDNPALSEAVQRMLFGLGYFWQSGKSGLFRMFYPYLQTCDHGALLQREDAHESLPRFNSATQFGELIAFLTAPENPRLPLGAEITSDGSVFLGEMHGTLKISGEQWDEITAAKAARVKKEEPARVQLGGCRASVGRFAAYLEFTSPVNSFTLTSEELNELHAASVAARKGAE